MGVREIQTSLQDDVGERYRLDGCEMLNFGEEFDKLKSIVRARHPIVRVQPTLQTQICDERWRGSPSGSVLRGSLSSLSTYSTWEGDLSNHISRGENSVDDGGMSG